MRSEGRGKKDIVRQDISVFGVSKFKERRNRTMRERRLWGRTLGQDDFARERQSSTGSKKKRRGKEKGDGLLGIPGGKSRGEKSC